jgi:hypothetical protein
MQSIRFKRRTTHRRRYAEDFGNTTGKTKEAKIFPALRVGVLKWRCVECGRAVSVEFRPGMRPEYEAAIEKIFDAKLCTGCYEAQQHAEAREQIDGEPTAV